MRNLKNQHPTLIRFLRLILIILPLIFLFANLAANWQTLVSYEWHVNGARVAASIVLLTGAFAILPVSTQRALNIAGAPLGYREAYRAYHLTQLTKYLPGGLWLIPSRLFWLNQYGIRIAVSSLALILELTMLVLTGALVFIPYLLVISPHSLRMPLIAVLPLVSIPPARRGILERLGDRLASLLGYSGMRIHLTFPQLLILLLIDIGFWLMAGLGFYILVTSIEPAPLSNWLPMTAAFSMAWVIGFLAFLAPGGLGVREGALALLLTPFLPPPLPVVVSLLARIWWMVAELVSVGIGTLLGETPPSG